ncbi:MAG TPA: SDR family NAD(P)-dependent oxidoreductase [Longimicrobiales bacterium]|nr:SDR family NAD(P)-dependent oxidoreductase [Longimicrobiales bacterium]
MRGPGLDGLAALVTGASSGIGRALALALAAAGADTVLVGRDRARLHAVAGEAERLGATAIVEALDLTDDAAVRALAAGIAAEPGGLDVLVHAAGVIALGPTDAASLEDLDRQYRTNLRAPYLLTKLLLRPLRARRGQVVFINSTVALGARPNLGAYAATKHGLRAVADSLRAEVNPDGVRVMTVYLGRTATPMQAAVHRYEARPYRPERLIQPEDVATAVVHLLALPRTVQVTDIRLLPERKPLDDALPGDAGAAAAPGDATVRSAPGGAAATPDSSNPTVR